MFARARSQDDFDNFRFLGGISFVPFRPLTGTYVSFCRPPIIQKNRSENKGSHFDLKQIMLYTPIRAR